jgi:hypothetical protein
MARSPDAVAAAQDLPAPRHATLWASLVFAISTMLLAYPALAGKFLLAPWSDQYKAGYAFREFGAQSLRSGHGFPLWNPYLQGGLPYVAAMHGDIFYPTFLLRLVLPTDLAMTWEFPIHLFLCGLLTYLFLRAWRFGYYAALVGGLAYMLGGSIAGYASPGHDGKLFVSTMLPIALLLLTRGIRDGRLWAWGGLSLIVALAGLSPHPQLFEYMLLLSGVFALYVAFAEHPAYGRLPRNVAIQRLALSLGAVILGIAITSIQYMPLWEYKPWSPRSAGHDYATAASYSFPLEETLNAYWPQFSGILDKYWGRNLIHFHSDYFGVIVLLLFGAAFGQFRMRGFRRFWIGVGIVSLIWAYGGSTPLFHVILAIVPYTKYFRAPSTMIFETAFAVSVLAAIGMERVLASRVGVKYALGWAIAAVAVAVLMSVGGYSAISSGLTDGFDRLTGGAYGFAQRADQNSGSALLGIWRSTLFVLLGAGIVWALARGRIAAKGAAIALAALLVIDLWSVERFYWVFMPRASTIYATDPAIDAIKADIAKNGPGRVWTIDARLLPGSLANSDPFFSDALMSHDIRLALGYHGNELDRYQQLVAAANVMRNAPEPFLSPSAWRQENVRYIYTGASDSTMAQVSSQLQLSAPMSKLAGPVRNAAGSMVFAYKVPRDDPYAWVSTAIVKAPDEQSLSTVLDPRFVPASLAIADLSDISVNGATIAAMPAPSAASVVVKSYAPGAVDLELSQPAKAGEALVASENYFPGWSALVDGKTVHVTRMDFNLMGLALPAGARSVQLRFDDAAYEIGKRVTIVTLILGLVAWLAGIALDRRRGSPQLANG